MPEAGTTFHTDDLALAGFLSMNGLSYSMDRNGDSCIFVFDSAEDCSDLREKYERNAARVEPRRFMREVGYVRSGMYAFLDGRAA